MTRAISSILRTTQKRDRLNILTYSTHEAYQSLLDKTGHNFYLIDGDGMKQWNRVFREVPPGHQILRGNKVPEWVDIDLILTQNLVTYETSVRFQRFFQVPHLRIEHCMPTNFSQKQVALFKQKYLFDRQVFITEYSRDAWGFNETDSTVVQHAVDYDVFKPSETVERKAHVLTVCNDFITRDHQCGYSLFRHCTNQLPIRIVGDTPGLSKPAKDIAELVNEYQSSLIYFNPAISSPVPMSMLEAMASGCCIVTVANPMTRLLVNNAVNGFVVESTEEAQSKIKYLLKNQVVAASMGAKGRKSLMEKLPIEKFIKEWNDVLCTTAKCV